MSRSIFFRDLYFVAPTSGLNVLSSFATENTKKQRFMGFLLLILLIIIVVMMMPQETQPLAATTRNGNAWTEKHVQTGKPQYSDTTRRAAKHLKAAMGHFEAQRWPQVVEECEKVIVIDPDMVFGYGESRYVFLGKSIPRIWSLTFGHINIAMMGNALNVMMQWEQAAGSWRKALELDPSQFEFYYHLGFALSQHAQDQVTNQHKYDIGKESIQSFETYLKLVEHEPEATLEQMSLAHTSLGSMYKAIKLAEKQELALNHFESAVTLDATNELAFFNIGLMYAEKFEKHQRVDDLKMALRSIEKAVELNPANGKYVAIRDALLGNTSPAELMAVMKQLS
jgi:tetratricopeptide (TPR) repeat protein